MDVAVKKLPAPQTPEEMDRFASEVTTLYVASTRVRNACLFYGLCGVDGHICLVMKLYKGGSISAALERGGSCGLPLETALRYGRDVARAMMGLHREGIIMGDLKPANVLIDAEGSAVVSDFGVAARARGHRAGERGGYRPSSIVGSPQYMAPESWDPKKFGGEVTARADVWSFGCTFLEMCTGHPPWEGRTMDHICRAVVDRGEIPEVPAHLPIRLREAVRSCFSAPALRPSFDSLERLIASELDMLERAVAYGPSLHR
eukprot:CAMPEP_0182907986 /NCGR_PEP_ID=MMETSP0034_2-20130328/34901_1 /TAXON_ID=156128 /ORGANISM="Nephroselmis pyriformis, Strain CCMP717" /LENGTH=259 /DNA_ID=CAMNT_0025044077 /DNA_START=1 /DNA_END=777 /DNA_ORIENTATION=+